MPRTLTMNDLVWTDDWLLAMDGVFAVARLCIDGSKIKPGARDAEWTRALYLRALAGLCQEKGYDLQWDVGPQRPLNEV